MKALVAEDSGVMRKIICRGLSSIWVDEVIEAEDGRVAFDLFQQDPSFDLVVTDWNMPNMNGLELVEAIRATGSTVKILMVTTEGEKLKVVTALKAGVNDYLMKPFDKDLLEMKLTRLLPHGSTTT